MTGTVHHWNRLGRYGKVTGNADHRLYFVHQSQVRDEAELQTGQPVEFTPVEAPRGPRAIRVRPLEAQVSASGPGR